MNGIVIRERAVLALVREGPNDALQVMSRALVVPERIVQEAEVLVRLYFEGRVADLLRETERALAGLQSAVVISQDERIEACAGEQPCQPASVAERLRQGLCLP